jgi:Cu/Ag efflux protein CusF
MNVARESILPVLLFVWLVVSAATPVRCEVSTNQVQPATEPAREEAKERRARLSIAKGVLKEVDLLRRQLKLTTEDGVRTFTYTERTYIFRDKDKITVDKLKRGEIIAVRFDTDKDGNATVIRIKAQGSLVSTNQPANSAP